MGFIKFNPNPNAERVGDCVIRAVSKATGVDWDTAYVGVALKGFELCDMPSANHVWGEYLKQRGFKRELAEHGITVSEFAKSHPLGTFVLAISGHVVCVKDGDWYDTWNSSDEIPIYVWAKMEVEQ